MMAKDNERAVGQNQPEDTPVVIGDREVFIARLEEGFTEVSQGSGNKWMGDFRIMSIWVFSQPNYQGDQQLDIATYELQKSRDAGGHTFGSRGFEARYKPSDFEILLENHDIHLGKRVSLSGLLGIRKKLNKIYNTD